jgi:hypothetical protein
MAAAYPEAQDLLRRLPEARLDPGLRALLTARASLYNDTARDPQQILDGLRARHPTLAEIGLLEAEVLFVQGRSNEARQALDRQATAGAPAWAVKTAQVLQTLLSP